MRIQVPRFVQSLRSDLLAGVTVAMVGTPQCMAYAAIAGVAPIYGLYTGIVPTIVGSLLGSSSFLVTGPSNATSLVTANVLRTMANPDLYVEAVFALAVLSGLIKLLLGILNLGWIIRYVSNAVLMGFLTGASTLIILGQLNNVVGLPRASGAGSVAILRNLLGGLPQINLYALAVCLLTIIVLLISKRLNKRLPAELASIGVAGLAVYVLGWANRGVLLVSDLGTLSDASLRLHLPALALPDWQMLLPSAGAVALFSLVEAMSIAQAVGGAAGERVNPTREFVGQGLASLVGGFFQCIPSSGSPSRTAVNYSSGARTRLAGALSGLIVLLGLVVFGPLMNHIPFASLAGVIIITAFNLVDRRQLVLAWHSRVSGRIVLIVTLGATLLLPLHIAIYLGVLLSIAIYVLESSKLQLSYLSRTPSGSFIEHTLDDVLHNPPAIAIVNIEGTLEFGAADELEQRLNEIIRSGVRVVILRLRRVHMLNSTGVVALDHIATFANRSGTRVLMCGVHDEVEATLEAAGLAHVMGEGRIFRASAVLFASTQQALARAEEIVLAQRTHGD